MARRPQPLRQPRRVFLGPGEIAGYYSNLNKGFSLIGQPADFYDVRGHPFRYKGADTLPRFLRWRAGLKLESRQSGLLARVALTTLANVLYLIWTTRLLVRYDAFIFSFGDSLLPRNLDLPLLRLLGKVVVCNLSHGSEARPPYLDGSRYSHDGKHPGLDELRRLTRRTEARVKRCEKYATWIIGAPHSSSPFLTKPFINAFALGLPFAIESGTHETAGNETTSSRNRRGFRILHSPSHPFVKGTVQIKQAVQSLISEGFDIEFIELRGVPNATVLEEIKKCDFVIDQIFSDTPMAGFALEASANGKPAIVGGEHLKELKSFVHPEMWPPTLLCKPNGIEATVRNLLLNHLEIVPRGLEARDFVNQKWRADKVAERYLSILRNQIPDEWLLDPKIVPFPRECGMSRMEAQGNIEGIVQSFGEDALGQLSSP